MAADPLLRYTGAVSIPLCVPLRGLDRMADKNRDEELPQRVKGAARLSPARSAPASALSDELRQRMRAAVDAERAETRERAGQPGQPAVASPPAAADDGVAAATNGKTGPVNGRDKGSGKPPAGAAVSRRPGLRSDPSPRLTMSSPNGSAPR